MFSREAVEILLTYFLIYFFNLGLLIMFQSNHTKRINQISHENVKRQLQKGGNPLTTDKFIFRLMRGSVFKPVQHQHACLQ